MRLVPPAILQIVQPTLQHCSPPLQRSDHASSDHGQASPKRRMLPAQIPRGAIIADLFAITPTCLDTSAADFLDPQAAKSHRINKITPLQICDSDIDLPYIIQSMSCSLSVLRATRLLCFVGESRSKQVNNQSHCSQRCRSGWIVIGIHFHNVHADDAAFGRNCPQHVT